MVDAFLLPMSLAWDIGIEPVDIGLKHAACSDSLKPRQEAP